MGHWTLSSAQKKGIVIIKSQEWGNKKRRRLRIRLRLSSLLARSPRPSRAPSPAAARHGSPRRALPRGDAPQRRLRHLRRRWRLRGRAGAPSLPPSPSSPASRSGICHSLSPQGFSLWFLIGCLSFVGGGLRRSQDLGDEQPRGNISSPSFPSSLLFHSYQFVAIVHRPISEGNVGCSDDETYVWCDMFWIKVACERMSIVICARLLGRVFRVAWSLFVLVPFGVRSSPVTHPDESLPWTEEYTCLWFLFFSTRIVLMPQGLDVMMQAFLAFIYGLVYADEWLFCIGGDAWKILCSFFISFRFLRTQFSLTSTCM